jgi:hypothetical protein
MKNRINHYLHKTDQRLFSENIDIEKAINDEFERLNESSMSHGKDTFDIFLSHSYMDKKIIYGVYEEFVEMGYSVYVDWLKDRRLDRRHISKTTAQKLKERMQQSRCLFYITSNNTQESVWMPWELGYMDGYNGKVVTFPLLEDDEEEYYLPEYLDLYYYAEKGRVQTTREMTLWVHENTTKYVKFDQWLNGSIPYYHE